MDAICPQSTTINTPPTTNAKLISLMGSCRWLRNKFRVGISNGENAGKLGRDLWKVIRSWGPQHKELSWEFVAEQFSQEYDPTISGTGLISRKTGKPILLRNGFHLSENGQLNIDVFGIGPVNLFVEDASELEFCITLTELRNGEVLVQKQS